METILAAPVASVIFAVTILISLIAFNNEDFLVMSMLHPYSVSRGQRLYGVITSGFIHRDWVHLLFNMMSFFFFAFQFEETIGHWQFAVLYFASLILSDMPSVIKHREDYGYHSLGASGAISAVIFGFIMYYPTTLMMIMPIPIEMWAVVFGVLYLIYCTYASKYSRDAINHDAHLYGALSGIVITILFNPMVVSNFLGKITVGVQGLLHH
jgi:membrane associated rhomboid family serine protease